jgi:hypothetical protein
MGIEPHPVIPNPVLAQTLLIVFLFALFRAKLSMNEKKPLGDVVPSLAHQSKFTIALNTFLHRKPSRKIKWFAAIYEGP